MNAFQFGRRMRIKLADANQQYSISSSRGTPLISPRGPSLTSLQQPAAPPTPVAPEPSRIMPLGVARSEPEKPMSIGLPGAPPKPQPPFQPALMTTGQSSPQPALPYSKPEERKSNGGVRSWWQEWWDPPYNSHTGLGTYADTMERWYNPWSAQEVKERGEKGLMRTGQAALGTAALAGGTAAAITAAPALGFGGGAATGTAGTTAATAGTGIAAASQTPAAQNFMQRMPQLAQAAQTFQTRVMPRANQIANTLDQMKYSPDAVLHDVYAAGTGHFDQIKGPGWSGALKPLGGPSSLLPPGSGMPSVPSPSVVAKQLYGTANNAAANLLSLGGR